MAISDTLLMVIATVQSQLRSLATSACGGMVKRASPSQAVQPQIAAVCLRAASALCFQPNSQFDPGVQRFAHWSQWLQLVVFGVSRSYGRLVSSDGCWTVCRSFLSAVRIFCNGCFHLLLQTVAPEQLLTFFPLIHACAGSSAMHTFSCTDLRGL